MRAFTSTNGVRFSERKAYVRVEQGPWRLPQIDPVEFASALKEYVDHVRASEVAP